MQIKRFEAVDMTDALRMVKREFGDDAVILSAKEVRPGGLFSALRKRSVEITAAADYPLDGARGSHEFSGVLSKQLDTESQNDRVSLSAPKSLPKAFTRNAHPFPQQPKAAEKENTRVKKRLDILEQRRIKESGKSVSAKAIRPDTGEAPRGGKTSANELIGYLQAHHLVADPFYDNAQKRNVVALVGPPGVGKSTTVAKLARHCLMVEKKRLGLISLDRFRIGANGMLESAARIMNLPLAIVHDADQMQRALTDLSDVDVVLIDTPGMGNTNASMMEDVRRLLQMAHPNEIHLVVNATVRDEVLATTMKHFSIVGANRLLFTHIDEYGSSTSVLRLLKKTHLPSAFYTDGLDLFDDLHTTTIDRLTEFCFPAVPAGGQVTAFPSKAAHMNTEPFGSSDGGGSIKYVANRNSELFHHPHCKSVKRINAENIATFNSLEQAIEDGFKPCRACCDISMREKSVTGAFNHQRVNAL